MPNDAPISLTQSRGKRPRTASRATRRRQLIEATIDSIATHGVSGTTMASVTSRAGLSMGIVSYHFQSKENLMRETLIFLVEEHRRFWISALDDPELTAAEKLRAVIEAHFHPSVCTTQRIAVWFAFFGEAKYRAVYRKRVGRYDAERIEIIEQICREIVADGGYEGIDPAAMALSLECLADGLWLSMLVCPDQLPPAEAKANIFHALARSFPRHFPPAPSVLSRVRR